MRDEDEAASRGKPDDNSCCFVEMTEGWPEPPEAVELRSLEEPLKTFEADTGALLMKNYKGSQKSSGGQKKLKSLGLLLPIKITLRTTIKHTR